MRPKLIMLPYQCLQLSGGGRTNRLYTCNLVSSTVASIAGVERVFSSFGLVQTKLRNQTGTDKTSKFVFEPELETLV